MKRAPRSAYEISSTVRSAATPSPLENVVSGTRARRPSSALARLSLPTIARPAGGTFSMNVANCARSLGSSASDAMWSFSMLVTIATVGLRCRNEPSDSSASVTNHGPLPARALLPVSTRTPPTATVGSSPARSKIVASMPVVVVLPCVPATATSRCPRVSSASISPRVTIRTLRARAAAYSGLSRAIADETTTVPASAPRFSARWPTLTRTPSLSRHATKAERPTSEPLTRAPRASSRRAIALIPIPPTPTRW